MLAQKLIDVCGIGDYFFTVHRKSEYNTTGKTELHNIDSVEPILVGEFQIILAVLKYKIEAALYR